MAKNQAAPMAPRATPVAGRRTDVVPTGSQQNDPMRSPATRSSEKMPNLGAWNQTRSGGRAKSKK